MNKVDPQALLNEIYAEGDIDLLFFGFLAGYTSHFPDDLPYGKSETQIFEDTLAIARYLVENKDFAGGEMENSKNGVHFVDFPKGFLDFERVARQGMLGGGLQSDTLRWELALRKCVAGTPPPPIPKAISKCFLPKSA